jgi:hypothetical protein
VLDRQGSRFALEVLFLGALATGLALAKLDALEIVGAMVLGWLVVALLEWAAWRGEPHYGAGLPPRYYVPRTSLPPPQPLEQVFAGYPAPGREEAPTWIASAELRAQVLLGEWPVTTAANEAGEDADDDVEPVQLPPAPAPEPLRAPPARPLPPLPAAVLETYGTARHELEPFAPPPVRGVLRRRKIVELVSVEVPARVVPVVPPRQLLEE